MRPMPSAKTIGKTRSTARRATPSAPTRPRAPADRPDPSTIGGRLVICREAAGKTQAEAARAIKIKQPSLADLESGKSKEPKGSTLLNMRDKLGYDPDYVMRGRGMPLLPTEVEAIVKETTLIGIFRELRPEVRDNLVSIAQGLRRAQGTGPSASDPFEKDVPDDDDQ